MKILLLSNDANLLQIINDPHLIEPGSLSIIEESKDPIEVISLICSSHSSFLLIDDDFLKPNSVNILKLIKKIYPHTPVIFFTSDPGIELGREISQLGVQFYAVKPITRDEFRDIFHSIIKRRIDLQTKIS